MRIYIINSYTNLFLLHSNIDFSCPRQLISSIQICPVPLPKLFTFSAPNLQNSFVLFFFSFVWGWRGWTVYRPNFLFIFFLILLKSWPLYLSFLPPLTIFIHQILFWMCYSILFFVCLIRRKVKLNKHTQSTFMHNHVYLWNIEGVLCVHVNVAQNQSSYG